MRAAAQSAVKDPARAARVGKGIDALAADIAALETAVGAMRVSLRRLNAAPDTRPEDILGYLDGFDARRRDIRASLLNHHFELLAATTADEWTHLAPHERKVLSASVR